MSDTRNVDARGTIVPVFQPVVSLRSGRVVGLEALARLRTRFDLLAPEHFLPHRDDSDARLSLFSTMLAKSIDTYIRLGLDGHAVYLSVNVDAKLVLGSDFGDLVRFILVDRAFDPRNLVLEILESEAIEDLPRMSLALERLKAMGIRFALDDVGSAYASLVNIKDLPIDILKLDQAFARQLEKRPHDLHFVMSLLGLARGLGKTLIVEGAETAPILDALVILGVEFVQGYALSQPLTEAQLKPFLKTWGPCGASRTPRSLLGSYASHLTVVETCRMLCNQPLPIQWKEESKNPHSCEIGKFFDSAGLHDTPYGAAHKRFHRVLGAYDTEPQTWEAGAEAFRRELVKAILEVGEPEIDAPETCIRSRQAVS